MNNWRALSFGRTVGAIVLAAAVLVMTVGATSAAAHSGKQSYLYVSIFGTEVEGRVEIPIADLSRVLGFDIPDDDAGFRSAISANRATIQDYIDDHLALGDGDTTWNLVFDDDFGFLPLAGGSYAQFPFDVNETFDREVRAFTVEFDVIYEADPNRDNLVIIENDWRSATYGNEGDPIIGLSTGMAPQRVELTDVSMLSSLSELGRLGRDVIRLQADLLFTIIALVVPIALLSAAAGNRREAPDRSELLERGRQVLVPFLVAQALTLWVVALGSVELGGRVTSTIAAGGLFVAATAILATWWRPAIGRFVPVAATIAGGASGVVAGATATQLGLQRSRPVLSLAAYHLGLVLVVLAVALGIGIVLAQLRHSRFAPTVAVVAGSVFAALAVAWALAPLTAQSIKIDVVDDQPEGLSSQVAILVGLLIVAVAVRTVDRRADRLRTIHEPS